MILNVWTVSALFLAAIGAGLATTGAWICLRGLRARQPESGAEEAQDRLHLLALVLCVLAGVRFLAWPHFYFLLDSYVPDLMVFGVMCAFGVTRIDPEQVFALELLKPIVVLGLGFWFLTGSSSPERTRARLILALSLSALALSECILEVLYLFGERSGTPVTCCTQFLETSAASSGGLGERGGQLGALTPNGALVLDLATTALTIAVLLGLRRRARIPRPAATLFALAVAGLVNLALTLQAWTDALAPKVLGLPYHHCVYELLTETPALGPAALCAVLGNGTLVWPLALHTWSHGDSGRAQLTRGVLGFAALALATHWILVVLHLG